MSMTLEGSCMDTHHCNTARLILLRYLDSTSRPNGEEGCEVCGGWEEEQGGLLAEWPCC
jgi:hypothetical protein